jgi:ABC-type Fe3+ transport system permease subunit
MQYFLHLIHVTLTSNPFAATLSSKEVQEACDSGSGFFDFPVWYKYLQVTTEVDGNSVCSPRLEGLTDIWLIALAVVEMLLRIAILVAIIYVVISGIKFITARGNPDKIQNARNSVQDALIGIVIAVAATAIVSFIAGRFSAS